MGYQECELININAIKERYYINEAKEYKIHDLPKEYTIIIENYHYMDPNVKYWDQKIITIYKNIGAKEPLKKICEFGRNYPSFKAAYVEQNGIEYLITSGDYQSIAIVNLNTGEVKEYADIQRRKHGWGFCPTWFNADEDYLCIEGCYWGGDMERMHCYGIDYSNPIEAFDNAEWSDDENNFYNDDDEEDED